MLPVDRIIFVKFIVNKGGRIIFSRYFEKFYKGCSSFYGFCPSATFDEIMVFKKVLSISEVGALMNGHFFCNGIDSTSWNVCRYFFLN
jgi:hypothetical protein